LTFSFFFFSARDFDEAELSLYSENSLDDDFISSNRKSTKKRDKKLNWKIASLSSFQRMQLCSKPKVAKNERKYEHKKRKEADGNSIDILESLENNESVAVCMNTKDQSFEEKVLNLLSKCRDFCPKIYNKLDRLAKKSKKNCSRTNFRTSSKLSELGEYSY
jgi:hypothetical protein